MIKAIKCLLLFVFVASTLATIAQSPNGTDKKVLSQLKKDISFLASDKLEGRRTGTAGEALAYKYIIEKLQTAKVAPAFASGYLQAFEVKEGKELAAGNKLRILEEDFVLNTDYYPMPYSKIGTEKNNNHAAVLLRVINVQDLITENVGNPHFEVSAEIVSKINAGIATGSNLFLVLDEGKHPVQFDGTDRTPMMEVPVFFLTSSGKAKLKTQNILPEQISYSVAISEKIRTGHNVVGYINNNAAHTIVIGAHYDHLGYGEDHNSLYVGKTPMIHNGADDNASGTAAMLSLAAYLSKENVKNYNYLLAAFSGEELGLFGSKYLANNLPIPKEQITYMINMDMVGRLPDSTQAMTVGGYGTSPQWSEIFSKIETPITLRFDSSGSGPSDHTSFYRKDIPVLFFFTGSHKDYHKPSDDADKINFSGELQIINLIKNIIHTTATYPKLSFAKTKEPVMGKSSFKVTLGIMPDYTYDGVGVRVDGVSDDRPASKAGILAGDVIIQLGDIPFTDVMSYMGALNKFEKGETTEVVFKRGEKEMKSKITF